MASSNSVPFGGATNGDKEIPNAEYLLVQFVTKLLQRNQGFLTLHKLLELILKEEPSLCNIFNNSSDGLFIFLKIVILKGPSYFHGFIVGDILYLVSTFGKKKLKKLLQELAKSSTAVTMVSCPDSLDFTSTSAVPPSKDIDTILSAKLIISLVNILEHETNGIALDILFKKLQSEREVELKGTGLESSLECFRKYILKHPGEFSLLPNDTVKSIVDIESHGVAKAILAVKMTIWLKGGMVNIKNLIGHFSNFPNVRMVTGGSIDSLEKFIREHSSIFLLHPNGDVYVREVKSTPSPPAVKPKITVKTQVSQKYEVLWLTNTIKQESNGLTLESLYKRLQSEQQEELKGTEFESLEKLKKFILHHPREFSLSSNGTVKCVCIEPASIDKVISTIKSIILVKGGSVKTKVLIGHLSDLPDIRKVTGGSYDLLESFLLEHASIFFIKPNKEVCLRDATDLNSPAGQSKSVVKRQHSGKDEASMDSNKSKGHVLYCQSVIVALFLKFGFIKYGDGEDDNIYFDTKSVVHPSHSGPVEEIDDLKKIVKVGEKVDCIFMDSKSPGVHKSKFKASVVWKVPNGITNDLCLSPIMALQFNVLLGSAVITFKYGPVGSCKINDDKISEEKIDSLIEFDPKKKTDVTSIGFHTGWLLPSKKLSGVLKLGKKMNFIAKPKSKFAGRMSSHWIAISMWSKSRKKSLGESLNAKYVVKAEVLELTSEGGTMSFGTNAWAHRAMFQWEDLANKINGFLTFSVGDAYWCVIAENSQILGSTKWFVHQLAPYDVTDGDIPPLNFRHFPLQNGANEPTSILDTNNIGILAPAITEMSNVAEKLPIFDKDVFNFSNLSTSLSFSTASLSGVGLNDQKSDSIDKSSIVVEDGRGIIVSRDFYGGMLEGDSGDVVYFGAHTFYFNGRPISHLAFPERTSVHYEARVNPNDLNSMTADKVWIGRKPSCN